VIKTTINAQYLACSPIYLQIDRGFDRTPILLNKQIDVVALSQIHFFRFIQVAALAQHALIPGPGQAYISEVLCESPLSVPFLVWLQRIFIATCCCADTIFMRRCWQFSSWPG